MKMSLSKLSIVAALSAVGCGHAASTSPYLGRGDDSGYVVLRVDAVRVAGLDPAGATWDGAKSGDTGFGCTVLGTLAGFATGNMEVASGATALCNSGTSHDEPEQSPTAPDLYVRLRASDAASYESFTAQDGFYVRFAQDFIVPTAAVTEDGLELMVFDRDGNGRNQDALLGRVIIPREQALDVGGRHSFSEAAIEQLDVTILSHDGKPRTVSVSMPADAGIQSVPDLRVPAGAVISARATGSYRVGSWYDQDLTPVGYSGGGPRQYNLPIEPFRAAAHGSGLILVGQRQTMQGASVAPCGSMMALYGGELRVGINDRDARNNTGMLQFEAQIDPPSVEQWLHPSAPEVCAPAMTSLRADL
jgi:hypothetical protein